MSGDFVINHEFRTEPVESKWIGDLPNLSERVLTSYVFHADVEFRLGEQRLRVPGPPSPILDLVRQLTAFVHSPQTFNAHRLWFVPTDDNIAIREVDGVVKMQSSEDDTTMQIPLPEFRSAFLVFAPRVFAEIEERFPVVVENEVYQVIKSEAVSE